MGRAEYSVWDMIEYAGLGGGHVATSAAVIATRLDALALREAEAARACCGERTQQLYKTHDVHGQWMGAHLKGDTEPQHPASDDNAFAVGPQWHGLVSL